MAIEQNWGRMIRHAYPNTPIGPKRAFVSAMSNIRKHINDDDYKYIVETQSKITCKKEYEEWKKNLEDIEVRFNTSLSKTKRSNKIW